MRLLELSLIAYGAFRDRRLDLSHDGLHLIYGDNEAGKSTTLRAIIGLLFGIERQSGDAQLLGGPNLRIGARLCDERGHQLEVVRRKGSKNTLLDSAGRAIEEEPLSRMLQGVSESLFRVMFGLDHESLRRGGEQLERGHGELGESLFQAGTGGESIRETMRALTEQADALFTPRGKQRRINEALRSYEQARKRMREATTRAEAFLEHKRVLDEERARADAQNERRQTLLEEQSLLQRARRVRPKLAKRRELLARRSEIGDVPALPGDAPERRLAAQRELSVCELAAREQTQRIDKLRSRRDALEIPQSLSEIAPELIATMRDRLGNHRKAAADLPRRRGQLRALENAAQSMLRSLGHPRLKLDKAHELSVDQATETRVMGLAKEHSGLVERMSAAREQVAELGDSLEACRQEQRRLGEIPDAAPLQEALSRARAAGDLDGRIASRRAQASALEQRIADRLRALACYRGTAERLAQLPLPQPQTVAVCRERADANERRCEQQSQARQALAERARRIERELSSMRAEGALPSEDELWGLRRARDEAFELLRQRLLSPEPATPAVASEEGVRRFEHKLREADELADRLRREAQRVTRERHLLAEQRAVDEERAELMQAERELEQERGRAQASFRELWRESGIEPLSPAEMAGWLDRVEALRELREQQVELESELAALQRARGELIEGCLAALRRCGSADRDDADELLEVAARVERCLQGAQDRARQLESVAARERELLAASRSAERKLQQAQAALERWTSRWSELMAELRLAADAEVEEAQALIAALGQLSSKLDEVEAMRGRIEGMERDATEFEKDVWRLVDLHLFQLREMSLEEAADELVHRYERAQSNLLERQRIEEDIEEASEKLAGYTRRAAEAEQALAELRRAAKVTSDDALEEVERRAAESKRIEAEVQALDDELLADGDGASIAELSEQTATLPADRAGPRLLDIERELEELDEAQRGLHHRIGGLSEGLSRMENDERAADAAAEAEAHLSRIKEHAQRYVQLRLAAHLLEREVQSYRERNQGPVMKRASELFARLTLRRYPRLQVGFDAKDQAVLLCVDEDGRDVPVTSLSDGARDQLYLALRLASLERFMKHGEPVPVVLDDILIHFDDARAAAALSVLGEFAEHTQVLFFTHHARLVELARAAIPHDRLVEHRLQGDRVRRTQQALPGLSR